MSYTLGTTVTDADIYVDPKTNPRAESFFKDLRASRLGDSLAADRLARNERQVADQEGRALSTSATAGGTFAPPLWLVQDFIALARPGRVTADLLHHELLPPGVSSINLPKVNAGTTTAVQTTQNTALSQTDLTTTSVSGQITTIGGKQVVSTQLIEQSGIPFDQVVLGDLAADYARQLDTQVLLGTGAPQLQGLTTVAGINPITYTTASPAVVSVTSANSFYNAVIRAANAVHAARFLPATAVVMHPTRWSWILEGLDGNNRPLLPAGGGAFNAVGSAGGDVAQGSAGTFANLPVFLDPSIPVNVGAGTNQDSVIVLRGDDSWLFESDIRLEAFDSTYADQASILYRCMSYSTLLHRLPGSISVINGTGLVAPTL